MINRNGEQVLLGMWKLEYKGFTASRKRVEIYKSLNPLNEESLLVLAFERPTAPVETPAPKSTVSGTAATARKKRQPERVPVVTKETSDD
jgi:hypothetical protein